MKKPLILMMSIIGGLAVVLGLAVGGYFYVKQRRVQAAHPKPPTAAELKNLRVDLPQNTTNVKDGLIQFSVSLEADTQATKTELMDLQPQVQNTINMTMKEFASDQLKTQAGLMGLENKIRDAVNEILPKGKVTGVYFSSEVVQ